MSKPKNTVSSLMYVTILSLVLGLLGCSSIREKSNFSSYVEETKTFSKSIVALNLSKPPPTPEPGSFSAPISVEEIKSELGVSSLKNISVIVTPRDREVTIESVELAIFENDRKVFSVPVKSIKNTKTLSPLVNADSNAAGYLFNIDPQTLDEGDRFFVAGNKVRLIARIKRESGINTTFYFVNKNSEVERGR